MGRAGAVGSGGVGVSVVGPTLPPQSESVVTSGRVTVTSW